MLRRFSAAGALLAAISTPVLAADLIIEDVETPVVDTGFINSVYFQVLGGYAKPGTYTYVGPASDFEYDLDGGFALAGTVGVFVFEGVSIEADALFTKRKQSDYDDYDTLTASLMANVKYTHALNETFSIYGAVGVGVVHIEELDAGELYKSGSGFGYQLIGGVTAELAEGIAAVAELRFQDAFDDVATDDEYGLRAPVATATVGLKFAF